MRCDKCRRIRKVYPYIFSHSHQTPSWTRWLCKSCADEIRRELDRIVPQ